MGSVVFDDAYGLVVILVREQYAVKHAVFAQSVDFCLSGYGVGAEVVFADIYVFAEFVEQFFDVFVVTVVEV